MRLSNRSQAESKMPLLAIQGRGKSTAGDGLVKGTFERFLLARHAALDHCHFCMSQAVFGFKKKNIRTIVMRGEGPQKRGKKL